MENNQKIYLDKVVEFLVKGTKIDYDQKRIQYPFLPSPFSKYCKNVYGLTEDEVKYVWNQYKDIILDKITNK